MSSVIDFHTHILPGIDDGSACVKETVEMLELEKAQGVEHVVFTPHFYASCDGLERFLERRGKALKEIEPILQQRQDLPKFSVGAEVEFFEGMSDCEYLYKLAIGSTNFILVEMPMKRWTDDMLAELEGIYQKQRMVPIIAHIDRYITRFRKFVRPEVLLNMPVLIQSSAEFFIQPSTRRKALKMLAKNQIHLLGSDAHNLETRRPNIDEALVIIREHCSKDAIERISQYQDRFFAAKAAQNI